MARNIRIPSYTLHRPTGTARSRIGGVYHSLGRFGSPASYAKYDRLIQEWRAAGCPRIDDLQRPTIDALVLAYYRWLEPQYPEPTLFRHRAALKTARMIYTGTFADEFGPRALKAVRQAMVDKGWSRPYINASVTLIVRMFRWAAEEELLDGSVWQALKAVAHLRRGRTDAPDHPPVRPVSNELIAATLPQLTPTVAAMVKLQLTAGMRPGEVCRMTGAEIETTGDVWMYRLAAHKTAHMGKARTVALGAAAQEILRPRLRKALSEPIFSPADALAEHRAAKRAARKSHPSVNRARDEARARAAAHLTNRADSDAKLNSSDPQLTDSPAHPLRRPYSVAAYRRAVARACERAGIEPAWHPNQLRHTRATEIRKAIGLEAASAVLGHTSVSTTEIYAERDAALAAEVARKMG